MKKKIMTSIKISKEIHTKMLHSIVASNLSLRGKSQWIIEAIENFLNIEDFPELVDIANEMEDLTEVVSFRMPEPIMDQLEKAVVTVRREFPSMEGVKSNIIRASVIQKLIR